LPRLFGRISSVSIILRINSRGLDEVIEAIYGDSFRVEAIGLLAVNIPDLVSIG
jgi:hypothetical protein